MKPISLIPKPIHMYGAAACGWSIADRWAGACERELQAAARRCDGRKRRPRKESLNRDDVTRETARHQRQELAWPARPPRSGLQPPSPYGSQCEGSEKSMKKREERTGGPDVYSRGSGGSTPDHLCAHGHVHRCWIRRVHPRSCASPTPEPPSIARGSMIPAGTSHPQAGGKLTTRTRQPGANGVARLCARHVLLLVVSATTEPFVPFS